jgi:hypothetical protein
MLLTLSHLVLANGQDGRCGWAGRLHSPDKPDTACILIAAQWDWFAVRVACPHSPFQQTCLEAKAQGNYTETTSSRSSRPWKSSALRV